MKVKKFNENVFDSMVEQRIDDCIITIGDSFNLVVKDKESAKKDLHEFLTKHYTKREQGGDNKTLSNGELEF